MAQHNPVGPEGQMKKNKEEHMAMKRREMLTGAAIVAGSQLLNSRTAQAQPARPLFTASNVNRFIRIAKRRGAFEQVLSLASQDLPGFIRSRFRLTPTQDQLLSGLRPDQLDLLISVINGLVDNPAPSLQMEVADLSPAVESPIEFITESKTTRSSLLDLPDVGDIDIDIVIICIKRRGDINETVDQELENISRGL